VKAAAMPTLLSGSKSWAIKGWLEESGGSMSHLLLKNGGEKIF
jgi:hypothetical protein